MRKLLYAIYAVICYLIFFAGLLYLIGFVESFIIPKNINTGANTSLYLSIIINLGLMMLFGLQHSIMARQSFKEKWTKVIPKPIERSTYILFTSIALALLMWLWQPVSYTFWDIRGSTAGYILTGVSLFGWVIALISTFLINHFELFGFKQVYEYVTDKQAQPIKFKTPGFYKIIRHPLYFGFLLAFWATPWLTAGHLLFAAGMTSYILIGIYYEEKDLVRKFGEKYRTYREKTAKLIPLN